MPKSNPILKIIEPTPLHMESCVDEIIQTRLQLQPNSQRCMARTFRFFQCTNKPSAMLPSGIGVCRMHARTWRTHGLITDKSLSERHVSDLTNNLSAAATPKDERWFTRDVMWKETSFFGVENLSDVSDAQY